MTRQIHGLGDAIARAFGTFLLAVLFLLFGSAFVHVLSEHLRLEDGYRWAGFGELRGPGGTVMWICGGDPSVDWRTLPLYALLYFAICWQIATLKPSRLAPLTCLLGLSLLEYSRLSSLLSLVDLEDYSPLADYLTLECAYLLCALIATALGSWLATRREVPRISAAVGWAGAVAFLVPVPYLMTQKVLSPVPGTILMLWMTYVLTAFLFIHAFVRRRSLRRLAWLWLASVFATLIVTDLI